MERFKREPVFLELEARKMAESQIQVLGMRESSFNGNRSQQQFTQPLHIGIVKSRTILANNRQAKSTL